MTDSKCEVCGEPAVHYTQDIREVEPVADEYGKKWRQLESVRSHFYCALHFVPPTGHPCPPPDAVDYWLARGRALLGKGSARNLCDTQSKEN